MRHEVAGCVFDLTLTDAPFTCDLPEGAPAQISVAGDRVVVEHRRFRAEIDPFTSRIVSTSEDPEVLPMILRTALSCRLPFEGGVLLHSAGVVLDGRAYLFHGVSGAGKSTISSLLPGALLSDELVSVRDLHARATGFWGTLDDRDAPRGAFPIAGLIALDRGAGVTLTPLPPPEAMRALLLVTVVPPHPRLWTPALRVVEQLAHARNFRLAWTASAENAAQVASLLHA